MTRVRQVSASQKTANLSPWALEYMKAALVPRSRKGASGLVLFHVPLRGGSGSDLGFGAPFLLRHWSSNRTFSPGENAMKTLTQWLLFLIIAVSLAICGCGKDKPAAAGGEAPKKPDTQEKRDRTNTEKVRQAREDADGTQ